MVMYKNATIFVFSETVRKNKEGTKIKTFDYENPLRSFRADVQPNTLTESELKLYGINEKKAKTRKAFLEIGEIIEDNTRVKVETDEGENGIYTVAPLNKWRRHSEVLLIPVENEK